MDIAQDCIVIPIHIVYKIFFNAKQGAEITLYKLNEWYMNVN